MNTNHYDQNNLKHVGWESTVSNNNGYRFLFSNENIINMSIKISELLEGVDPDGKTLVVTDNVIASALSNVISSSPSSNLGDIHTRYIIPQKEVDNYSISIINRAIELIVSKVRTEVEMQECNKNLSVWNSIRGGQNKLGLLPHAKIKLREKHPMRMAFNMNY